MDKSKDKPTIDTGAIRQWFAAQWPEIEAQISAKWERNVSIERIAVVGFYEPGVQSLRSLQMKAWTRGSQFPSHEELPEQVRKLMYNRRPNEEFIWGERGGPWTPTGIGFCSLYVSRPARMDPAIELERAA